MVMRGETTMGSVIALGLYLQLLVTPVYELLNNNIEINKVIPIFDRLYEYFNLESERVDNYNKYDISSEINIKNLSFFYKEGQMVLDNINLKLPKSGMIALVGRSGAGKSTIVKLLMGFYKTFSGKIIIGETDINDLNVSVLREKISFVPQEINLLNTSIKQNILCAKRGVSDEEIENVLEKGKIVEIGNHDELTRRSGIYYDFVYNTMGL